MQSLSVPTPTCRYTCENVVRVLRENKDSVMAMLEAFVHDPLINWRLLNTTDAGVADSNFIQDGSGRSGASLGFPCGGRVNPEGLLGSPYRERCTQRVCPGPLTAGGEAICLKDALLLARQCMLGLKFGVVAG